MGSSVEIFNQVFSGILFSVGYFRIIRVFRVFRYLLFLLEVMNQMNCGKLAPNVAIFGLKTTFLEFLHSFLGVLKIFKHLFKSLKLR